MLKYVQLLNWWNLFRKDHMTEAVILEVERFMGFLKVFVEAGFVEILSFSGYRHYMVIHLRSGNWDTELEIDKDQVRFKKVITGQTHIKNLSGILRTFDYTTEG